MFICQLASPLGPLTLVANQAALYGLYFDRHANRPASLDRLESASHDASPLRDAATQLAEYFCGTRRHFDLPLALTGTPFQQEVWRRLAQIDWGQTRTYRQIAAEIGRPSAVRAVGGAIGRNPLSIVIPCHRVVASNGRLAGFAGGLARKQWLLSHEVPDNSERKSSLNASSACAALAAS